MKHNIITNVLGFSSIGSKRELKSALEAYWGGTLSQEQLIQVGIILRKEHWNLQKSAGIDLIPSNDFSFYDKVLDLSMMVGAIPKPYRKFRKASTELETYFAMARGVQATKKKTYYDLKALPMVKWFDTNYHYIRPQFYKLQRFKLTSFKALNEFREAKELGIITKPVFIGPVSYLQLAKDSNSNWDQAKLSKRLLPVYFEMLHLLQDEGAKWIQFDEPYLAMDLDNATKVLYQEVYSAIRKEFPKLKIMVATYFGSLRENASLVCKLPICALHVDFTNGTSQEYVKELKVIVPLLGKKMTLSLGIVNGRNVWKNNFKASLPFVYTAVQQLGIKRIMISTSCSLLHVPVNLELERKIPVEILDWLAFGKQKVQELVTLSSIIARPKSDSSIKALQANTRSFNLRSHSKLIHNESVALRIKNSKNEQFERLHPFSVRNGIQKDFFKLPLFPTTTIGSFPQTNEIRGLRARLKNKSLSFEEYQNLIKEEIASVIKFQEQIGLDVLVHGEPERNDMVEYFGEQLSGFVFSQFGWVQSYGSRCVKPPIIYGDVSRLNSMTVEWSSYAQSLTDKPVKGMLTGPVTMFKWSFVRDDQPLEVTCLQIAFAIRDEVLDLEKAGIKIIQIDEAAIREALPLRKADQENYLSWAVKSFKICTSGVSDSTQIHTHMCYSKFNDMMTSIAAMDADVISIECSRSQMKLLDAFARFQYPNQIGPGVYDIHSSRIPKLIEMIALIDKALEVIPARQLWINPDCGLKTRTWKEVKAALLIMVKAARYARAKALKS